MFFFKDKTYTETDAASGKMILFQKKNYCHDRTKQDTLNVSLFLISPEKWKELAKLSLLNSSRKCAFHTETETQGFRTNEKKMHSGFHAANFTAHVCAAMIMQ